MINLSKLRAEHPKLLDYVQRHGYSDEYILRLNKMLDLLFEHEGEFTDYEDFYIKFVSPDGLHSGKAMSKPRRIALRTIRNFDELGVFPDGLVHGTPFGRITTYSKLIPEFQQVVDNYKLFSQKAGKRDNTIVAEAGNGANFLYHLQNQGATSLSVVSDSQVVSFFYASPKQIRGHSYRCCIAAVLNGNVDSPLWAECYRILCLLPPIKKRKKTLQYMQDSFAQDFMQRVDSSSKISLRDKAIVKLLYYTGIRGVDITKMKVSNINWATDTISLIQSKTDAPLVLPLRAVLGNAIFDYIKNERDNRLTLQNLFPNSHNSNVPMQASSLGMVVRRVMDKTGITEHDSPKGVRQFRHHMATHLLESGTSTTIISDILGHLSPLSINPYIDTDIEHLRDCGLDIDEFPLGRDVFK